MLYAHDTVQTHPHGSRFALSDLKIRGSRNFLRSNRKKCSRDPRTVHAEYRLAAGRWIRSHWRATARSSKGVTESAKIW